ncbi:hypothetical protein LT42_16555 [Pseudomonas lutea]|uniref:Uncharacterized protein n=1 Tax=Pseudomonas lutea TaxID=243924 RepID=A0A9X0JI70_9PSED|nr:hypothetical protein LT42_16555 [Pseudomonas lutea]
MAEVGIVPKGEGIELMVDHQIRPESVGAGLLANPVQTPLAQWLKVLVGLQLTGEGAWPRERA